MDTIKKRSVNVKAGKEMEKKGGLREQQQNEEARPFDRENHVKYLFMIVVPLTIIDLMTKDYLFEVSQPVLRTLRDEYASRHLDTFFEFISMFGDKYGFIVFMIVPYHFFDLEKAFTVALLNHASIALLSFLKSVNHEARPFHVWDIQPSKCTFEYGNPSGHSLYSLCMFLCLWDLACQQNKWRYGSWKHTLSFASTIVSIVLVSFSRIWHAVHTFNQIFSGWIWGFGLYYLFCYILYYEIRRFVYDIRNRSKWQLFSNFGTQNFVMLFTLGIAVYLIGSWLNPHPEEWQANIKKNCAKQISKPNTTTDPELHNFEKFLVDFGLIGPYLGIIIEQRYMGTHIYPQWNQVSIGKQILMLIISCIPVAIVSAPTFAIDKTKHSYLFVMIFKNILPPLMGNMCLYGLNKWISIKTGLANKSAKEIEPSSPGIKAPPAKKKQHCE